MQPQYRDAAENSIMQTISIAVSAILIAAGLVTAPSLINNARDSNAQGDLANVAYAQEAVNADAGHYFQNINYGDPSLAAYRGPDGKIIKFTTSGPVFNIAATCDDKYVLKSVSQSGHTFYRTSESPRILTDLDYAQSELGDCKVAVPESRFLLFKSIRSATDTGAAEYIANVEADGTTSRDEAPDTGDAGGDVGDGDQGGSDPDTAPESPQAPLALSTSTLAAAQVNVAYTAQLTASRTATFSVNGALPDGIRLDGDTLTGTPTVGGAFPLTVTATSKGETASANLVLRVELPASVGWTATGKAGAAFAGPSVGTSADGNTFLAAGTDKRVYLSMNHGDTYTDVTPKGVTGTWRTAISGDGNTAMVAIPGGTVFMGSTGSLSPDTWKASTMVLSTAAPLMKLTQQGHPLVSLNDGTVGYCSRSNLDDCLAYGSYGYRSIVNPSGGQIASMDATDFGSKVGFVWTTTNGYYYEMNAGVDAGGTYVHPQTTGKASLAATISGDGSTRWVSDSSTSTLYRITSALGTNTTQASWTNLGKADAYTTLDATASGKLVGTMSNGALYVIRNAPVTAATRTRWEPAAGTAAVTGFAVAPGSNRIAATTGAATSKPGYVYTGSVS